jgi:putative tryptophan/tyrosine transport system substrate-binding protein
MASHIERRKFLATLGGAAVAAWPLAARAQQAGKLPMIGLIGADPTSWGPWTAAFAARLRELGWIEGRTVAIEYRWTEGRPERPAEFAAEFARLNADIIVTNSSSAPTVKQATSTIPIVFVLGNDPLGSGLVANLARPGGNVTGLSIQQTDIAGKRLQLLSEVVPRLRRLAVMADANFPEGVREIGEVQAAARTLGLEVATHEIRRPEDIAPAFEVIRDRADALYVVVNALFNANRTRIITLALIARLPMILNTRDFVQAGSLISYGPAFPGVFRRAAEYVDKILRGAKPGEIPVEQATKFDLVINLTTAKALGLTIPESFLLRADEVIE